MYMQEAIEKLCEKAVASANRVVATDDVQQISANGLGISAFSDWCRQDVKLVQAFATLAEHWLAWMRSSPRDRKLSSPLIPILSSDKTSGWNGEMVIQSPVRNSRRMTAFQPSSSEMHGIRVLFDNFATHGQMSLDDFHCCFKTIGICSAHIRHRLFVFFADVTRFVPFLCVS